MGSSSFLLAINLFTTEITEEHRETLWQLV
jgi:hypothetical protein